jgi:hypothetical protein
VTRMLSNERELGLFAAEVLNDGDLLSRLRYSTILANPFNLSHFVNTELWTLESSWHLDIYASREQR